MLLSALSSALATRQLATLARGERLTGSVVGHHKNKLYVRVPGVVRAGKQGREVPLDAMLTVPWSHALLADPPAALGAELDVYVLRAQVADARLRVTLRPPAEWDEPPVEWARALRARDTSFWHCIQYLRRARARETNFWRCIQYLRRARGAQT